MKKDFEHIYGCLIGGAIGDAIGAPVKYMSYQMIQNIYGEKGVGGFSYNENSQEAVVTDDTQLTLFTAEGLLRSIARGKKKDIVPSYKDDVASVFRAYIRWLHTQGLNIPNWNPKSYDGWLIQVRKLHAYREPGLTCITSLGKGVMGRLNVPINNSRKSGTVIRSAPIGILKSDQVFECAMHIGAITHGHPTAYLAGAAYAFFISCIIRGYTLEASIEEVLTELNKYEGSASCIASIEEACQFAKEGEVTASKIHKLGKGFDANEALAIAIYCALVYQDDFFKGVLAAVNHSGDSNATAALVGNILGAYLGEKCIANDLKEKVEINKEIIQLSEDLVTEFKADEGWERKYPAW